MIAARIAVCFLALTAFAQQNAQQSPAQTQPKTAQPQPAPAVEPFGEAVAERVLSDFREGLVASAQQRALAAFDGAQMPGYNRFADSISALFLRYDSFRVFYRITQTATNSGRGLAMTEFTLEATPPDGAMPAVRRTGQLRFEFARSCKTWKIVDVQPRGFFEQF